MVDILMASYNGEKYISKQIDSILKQSYQDYRILIRDDGSSDDTVNILKKFKAQYPDKIVLIEDEVKCGRPESNFIQLSKYATSEYIMYCDQDDYWFPNKIEVTLKKMLEIEEKVGSQKPILVFADYKAVDEELKEIHKTKNSITAYNLDFNRLLVQNYATGCLIMINRALCLKIGEYDKAILMHDWWVALIASAMGEIYHIPQTLMLYRQHGDNCVGFVDVKSFKYRIKKIMDKKTRDAKYYYRDQARVFYERYREDLPIEKKEQLEAFLSIYQYKSKFKRILLLLKGNYTKSDFVRTLGQIWYI